MNIQRRITYTNILYYENLTQAQEAFLTGTNYDVFRQVKKERMKMICESMRTEEIETAMQQPKVVYAMLGASNYPDSVMHYLSQLRFEKETAGKHEGKICPLCNSEIDRDHPIKCKHSANLRTQRHDGLVTAIKKMINKTRKPATIILDNRMKPDIDLTIGTDRYCIDVNFSIEGVQQSRYIKKMTKYQAEPYNKRVIPIIVRYDGIIWQQSIEDLKVLPEIDIQKLYEAIYYHIALAYVKAEEKTGKLIDQMLEEQDAQARGITKDIGNQGEEIVITFGSGKGDNQPQVPHKG